MKAKDKTVTLPSSIFTVYSCSPLLNLSREASSLAATLNLPLSNHCLFIKIVLTAELLWLRRRLCWQIYFRVDLPAQGIAAEQGHITIEYCACSFRGKRDHCVSDFLVAEFVA